MLGNRGSVVGVLLVCTFFTIGLAPSAGANTIYTYTGNPYTTFFVGDSCTLGVGQCSTSGSFTLAAPLPDLLAFSDIFPTAFSFTDGVTTLTQATSGFIDFRAQTNSLGQITRWHVELASSISFPNIDIGTINQLPSCCANDFSDAMSSSTVLAGEAENSDAAGTWTMSTSAVPEPSSLLLLGTGLAVGARRWRKRKANAQH